MSDVPEYAAQGRIAAGETGRSAPDLWNVDLSRQEVDALCNALNEVLHGPEAIEEWEFETRMGVSREDAEFLLHRLSDENPLAG